MKTPLGKMCIVIRNGFIAGVSFGDRKGCDTHPLLTQCVRELQEYFSGLRTSFSVPCRADGTAFERKVWQALQQIPFGKTMSYGEIAATIGLPNAARAVGGACRKNPLLLLIPCHRVITASGALGGFSGGLRRKQRLLAHEQRHHHSRLTG